MFNKIFSIIHFFGLRILLVLVLLSFAILEIPNISFFQNENILMFSGKSSIREKKYDFILKDSIFRLGYFPTKEEIKKYKIPERIFQKIYYDILLNEEARIMGLDVSDSGIAEILRNDPIFFENKNQFSKEKFLNYKRNIQESQNSILDHFYEIAKRDQLIDTISKNFIIPNTIYKSILLYKKQIYKFDYIELSPSSFKKIENPQKKILKDWFNKNKENFKKPEYRKIKYIQISKKDIVIPRKIIEKRVQEFYEENKENYRFPEQRIIEKITFNSLKEAKLIKKQIDSKKNQKEFFLKNNKNIKIHKGNFLKEDFPESEVSHILSLPIGGISNIIQDIKKQEIYIIRIIDIKKGGLRPFSDVQKYIASSLEEEFSQKEVENLFKKIEDSRFQEKNLQEISSIYKIPIKNDSFDINGKNFFGKYIEDFQNKKDLVYHVFHDVKKINLNFISTGDGYIWYNIQDIIPSRFYSFEEIHDKILSLWKKEKSQKILDEKALSIMEEIKSGKSIDFIALKNKFLKKTISIQRDDQKIFIDQEITDKIFSHPKGYFGIIKNINNKNSRIIFKILDVYKPKTFNKEFLTLEEKKFILQGFTSDLISELFLLLQKLHPVKINMERYKDFVTTRINYHYE